MDKKNTETNTIIEVEIPLSEVFGFINKLVALTKDKATFNMKFSHYAEAPKNIQAALIKEGRMIES